MSVIDINANVKHAPSVVLYRRVVLKEIIEGLFIIHAFVFSPPQATYLCEDLYEI